MLILGLTGSFGTGKSFVASIFKEFGAKLIDADSLAHRAIKKGSSIYKKVLDAFGKEILDRCHNIDRRKLARIVFNNRRNLDRLNRIVHPEVIKEIRNEVNKNAETKGVIVIDAPLLIEANLLDLIDKLIVVKSSRKKQIERTMKKFGFKKEEVLKRIASQIPLQKKVEIADFVIDNGGTKSETRRQVIDIWDILTKMTNVKAQMTIE